MSMRHIESVKERGESRSDRGSISSTNFGSKECRLVGRSDTVLKGKGGPFNYEIGSDPHSVQDYARETSARVEVVKSTLYE